MGISPTFQIPNCKAVIKDPKFKVSGKTDLYFGFWDRCDDGSRRLATFHHKVPNRKAI